MNNLLFCFECSVNYCGTIFGIVTTIVSSMILWLFIRKYLSPQIRICQKISKVKDSLKNDFGYKIKVINKSNRASLREVQGKLYLMKQITNEDVDFVKQIPLEIETIALVSQYKTTVKEKRGARKKLYETILKIRKYFYKKRRKLSEKYILDNYTCYFTTFEKIENVLADNNYFLLFELNGAHINFHSKMPHIVRKKFFHRDIKNGVFRPGVSESIRNIKE